LSVWSGASASAARKYVGSSSSMADSSRTVTRTRGSQRQFCAASLTGPAGVWGVLHHVQDAGRGDVVEGL
jgi:hypothetical protein